MTRPASRVALLSHRTTARAAASPLLTYDVKGAFSCRSLRDSRALLPLIRACVPVQPEQGAARAISACPSSGPGPGSAQCCLTEELAVSPGQRGPGSPDTSKAGSHLWK